MYSFCFPRCFKTVYQSVLKQHFSYLVLYVISVRASNLISRILVCVNFLFAILLNYRSSLIFT